MSIWTTYTLSFVTWPPYGKDDGHSDINVQFIISFYIQYSLQYDSYTVGRDQLLWAKMSITLETVSMAMVPMHLNTDYIKMVSMVVAMEMDR